MSNTARGRTAQLIQTARDSGDRLTLKAPVEMATGVDSMLPAIEVEPETTYQQLEGFGGAFTEAAADTLSRLSPERRQEALCAYFDPQNGLGYTLGRTHINSCDFALGNYAYDEVAGDTRLENFDISRDRRLLIPMIRDAISIRGGEIRMLASPWSPPAWMKTNSEMNHGGQLKPECREAWALYFAKYIKAYAGEGIPIWAVTVQNEPAAVQVWDSCIYSGEDERDFVRYHLGPRLAAEGMGAVRILVWDHNKDLLVERAAAVLSDPEAAQYVWGVAFHWYSGDQFENLDEVHERFPGKNLLFTEGCLEHGPQLGEWYAGERYGHAIIGDLNHWAVGWIDWNMVLDETGGPNHVGNYCSAPIIADTRTDTLHFQSSYHYIGHFARYIKPGAARLGLRSRCPGLEATAFRNPDGTIVAVIMNATEARIDFSLSVGCGIACMTSPPRSIQTVVL
jgi:glucosylceramidase